MHMLHVTNSFTYTVLSHTLYFTGSKVGPPRTSFISSELILIPVIIDFWAVWSGLDLNVYVKNLPGDDSLKYPRSHSKINF